MTRTQEYSQRPKLSKHEQEHDKEEYGIFITP